MKTLIYFLLISSMIFLGCSKNYDDLNSVLNNNMLKPELSAKAGPITHTVPMTFLEAFTSTASASACSVDQVQALRAFWLVVLRPKSLSAQIGY